MSRRDAESPPPPSRWRHRPRVPLANGGGGGDFELRHWRSQPAAKRAPRSLRRRWTPPEIEIPNGHGSEDDGGYTSLRDILASPEYAAAVGSPVACGGGSGSCAEINIRNPLVKHAAYAYLQPTPSSMDGSGRRRRRSSPLCRLLLAGGELFGTCIGFVGALFRR